jgi:hypothetical protein
MNNYNIAVNTHANICTMPPPPPPETNIYAIVTLVEMLGISGNDKY